MSTVAENIIELVRAERVRLEAALPAWIESMALPGKPYGRFKFHAAERQPWLLYASQQMLSFAIDSGYWEQLNPDKQQEWLELLLSMQDQSTGLFVCTVVTTRDTADPAHWDATAYYRTITMKLVRRLNQIGVKPKYPLPKAESVTPTFDDLPRMLAALPWDTNTYGAGACAGAWATIRLQQLEDCGSAQTEDPYATRILEFLEARQNPETGFWDRSPNLEDGMNGLLKSLTPYEMLNRPLPRFERIIDSVLKVQRPDGSFGEGCSPWNALVLFTYLVRHTRYRLADIQAAARRLAPMVSLRRQPDDFYSTSNHGCMTEHAGVILCEKSWPIGDLQGNAHALSILKMIEGLIQTK